MTATAPTERNARVCAFAIQGDGSRSFGVHVHGLAVLVTAPEGEHDVGAALASAIAGLGPEGISPVAPETPAKPTSAKPVSKYEARCAARAAFSVGQRVWCNVNGSKGWTTITEVGTGRNKGRIKIQGERSWCPAHNFDAESRP